MHTHVHRSAGCRRDARPRPSWGAGHKVLGQAAPRKGLQGTAQRSGLSTQRPWCSTKQQPLAEAGTEALGTGVALLLS